MSMSVLHHTNSRICTAMRCINDVMHEDDIVQKGGFTGKNLKEVVAQLVNRVDKLGDLGSSRHEQTYTLKEALKAMANRKVVTVTNDGHGTVKVTKGPKAPRPNRRQKTQRRAGHRQPAAAMA